MPNTGKKIVLTLKEVNEDTGVPTGNTKPNILSDPDYIPPSIDTVACPISFDLTCPIMLISGGAGSMIYEFALQNSVLVNPAVAKVRISAVLSSVVQATITVVLPNATDNYFGGSFTSLTAGSYQLRVEYLNSADVVQATCTSGSSVVVS